MIRKLLLALLLALSLPVIGQAHKVISPAVQGTSSATPAGADTDVQYNDNGSFGGEGAFTYNASTDLLSVTNLEVTGDADIEGITQFQPPGRAQFVICGDATTINNNTVYYGPDLTLAANNEGLNCDINATGGTTEADEDEAVYGAQAFQVVSMVCRNEADANADISYTLRTAAGATVPSVTCTIADNARDCVADTQTTTEIAAGATVAVAAASTGDIGANNGFVCTIYAVF